MGKKRVTEIFVDQVDAQKGTCFHRQIEMAVEAVCSRIDPAFSVQFWSDMTIYGLKEAMMYLDGFVESQGFGKEDFADQFNDLSLIRQELETLAEDFRPQVIAFRF